MHATFVFVLAAAIRGIAYRDFGMKGVINGFVKSIDIMDLSRVITYA